MAIFVPKVSFSYAVYKQKAVKTYTYLQLS